MTLDTFALTAAFLTFVGLIACAVELGVTWRSTRAPGLLAVIVTTAGAAGLFLAATWLLVEGVRL